MLAISPISRERGIPADQLLVSRADMKGIITYASEALCKAQACREQDLIGQPHNLLRHPDMPAVIFQLVWQRIRAGSEVFAYVKNMAHTGEYYWTLSHLTPHPNAAGVTDGYQCYRRAAGSRSIAAIKSLYRDLRAIERGAASPADGLAQSRQHLDRLLAERGQGYDEFILALVLLDETDEAQAA